MARLTSGSGQLAFDIDGLIHAAEVDAAPPWQGAPLHFTTGYFRPEELDAAFEHWRFLHGSFDCIAQSHMWHRSPNLNEHIELGGHSIDTFDAELRCNDHKHRYGGERCWCVGGRMRLAVCEPCGWHVVASDENAAVEAWHDHALPGWRRLPIVPAFAGVRVERAGKLQAQWIADHYSAAAQVPGAPIITERSEHSTRHVPNCSPWVGYDLCGIPHERRTWRPGRPPVRS